jgi:glucose-1-phosphate cytidylyltransferase
MKVVILAGGFGTRLNEETNVKPKPMVDIGGKPILWHIMNIYSSFGYNEFIVLLGYKGYVIKEYFTNYFLHQSDVTIDLKNNNMEVHQNTAEPWKVTLIDTGLNTLTGGRIKRATEYIGDETFLLTYGDGVSDVDITASIDFHRSHGKAITMTAVQPAGRYGALNIETDATISRFLEKPLGDGSWINGGFFVCEPRILDYIAGDETVFEQEPLTTLAKKGELQAWKHDGYWACMDTLRDKISLTELWEGERAPWRRW